jgi:hypothetical protein
LGSKGEFRKAKEEKRKDNISPLPEIHLSISELKSVRDPATNKPKIAINYSFRSIPESPLFFDCFRGEIDSVEVLVTKIQLYLYSKRVDIATANRPPELKVKSFGTRESGSGKRRR